MDGPLQQVLLWGRSRDDQSPASLGSPSPGANSCVTWALAGDPASLFWTSVSHLKNEPERDDPSGGRELVHVE